MSNGVLVSTIVTKREEGLTHETVVPAPDPLPDLRVITMNAGLIITIRAGRVFFQTVTGLLSAHALGADQGMLPKEFWSLLGTACQIGFAPLTMSILMNAGELLAKLDMKYPQFRA